jgi:hypothetical protein
MPSVRPLLDQIETLKKEVAMRGTEVANLQISLGVANERLAQATHTLEARNAQVNTLHKKIRSDELELEAAKGDAERFAWWFTHDRKSNDRLIELHMKEINREPVSLDEWRTAIDAERSKQR